MCLGAKQHKTAPDKRQKMSLLQYSQQIQRSSREDIERYETRNTWPLSSCTIEIVVFDLTIPLLFWYGTK
jgi:hypothetical protein